MNFLCDVHISLKVSKRIEQLGYQSEHVNNILDKWNTKDSEIASYVDDNELILITKDQDFRNSFLVNHRPKKLVKINLGNISNNELLNILENNLDRIAEINTQSDSFMIELNKNDIWIVTK